MSAKSNVRFRIRARVGNGEASREMEIHGRDGWALHKLIEAGERGCTPLDTPGPRWSGYVHKLRTKGIVIETNNETHGGPFAGRHARYVLRSAVTVLDVYDPQAGVLNVASSR